MAKSFVDDNINQVMTEDFKGDTEKILKAFICDFVIKDKQDRLVKFFEKEKNWWKLKIEFHTSSCFDSKKLVDIKPSDQNAELVYLKMKELGATESCISFLDYLDNNEYQLDLRQKLVDFVGFLIETILYCPKARVGYFEGELRKIKSRSANFLRPPRRQPATNMRFAKVGLKNYLSTIVH